MKNVVESSTMIRIESDGADTHLQVTHDEQGSASFEFRPTGVDDPRPESVLAFSLQKDELKLMREALEVIENLDD